MIDQDKKYTCEEAVSFVESLASELGKKPMELLAGAGVSHTTWWAWQTGKTQPSARTLLVIEASAKR